MGHSQMNLAANCSPTGQASNGGSIHVDSSKSTASTSSESPKNQLLTQLKTNFPKAYGGLVLPPTAHEEDNSRVNILALLK